MPRRFAIALILVLLLVIPVGTYLYMQKTQSDIQKAANVSSFNLIFRYGVGGKNELNTYNDTYTRDMVVDPSITINFTLTVEEKWQILQKIAEVDFFNLPSNFTHDPSSWATPQVDYYLKVQNGTQTNEVSWIQYGLLMESNVKSRLDQLIICIQGTIEQKPEYKALPEPRGGYV